MSFLRESLKTFGSRILLVLANFPISVLVFRTLGAEGQSIYSSATTLATSSVVIGLLGVDAAHTYYLASGRYRPARVLANSILVLAVLSLLLIPVFRPLIRLLTSGKEDLLGPYLTLASWLIPAVGARYLLLSIFMARRRIEVFNLLYVAGNLLLLVLLAVGFALRPAEPSWALWSFLLSQLFMVAWAVVWVWRSEIRSAKDLDLKPSWTLLRDSLHYGLRGFLGTLLTTFIYRFDTILVIRWLGGAAQGHYFLAVFLAEKLTHITASVQAVLFPHISAATSDEANRLTPRVCRHTLLWVLLTGAILFAAAPLGRIVYSRGFLPCIAPIRILLPGIAALTISKLLSADLSGRDKRFVPTLFMALSLGLNLLLNLLWTRAYGIQGAAWASTLAYVAQAGLMLVYFWRVTGVKPSRVLFPDRQDLQAYGELLERLTRRRGGTR